MSVVFDGHDLGTMFDCGEPQVDWINPQPNTTTIPSRDGVVLRDKTLGALQIVFKVTAHGGTRTERRHQFSTLASWLNVEDARPLYLPDMTDPDGEPMYYLAIPSATSSLDRYMDGDRADLTFIALSPAAYGQTKTEELPSGGAIKIDYAGTYPASLIFDGYVVPDIQAGRYGITNQNGDYIHVKTSGENIPIHYIMVDGDTWGDLKSRTWGDIKDQTWQEATNATIIEDSRVFLWFDTAERRLRINDAYTTPTLDSNYFLLTYGANTITNDLGTGEAVITYTERWL